MRVPVTGQAAVRPGSAGVPVHLNWDYLLERLQGQVAGITHALVLAGDGLPIATTARLSRDAADQLSAFASGLVSLTGGIAALMKADPVIQTIVDTRGGYIIVMGIGDGSALAVLATKECEAGQVAAEMAELINSVSAG
ncbi:MAG: roadblock/LC7 domain-containing protein [Micromonosporaceae bacterium]|nr:roadblock/LC7 domain-containing protein [Micromonosporaceae bacterium]